MVTLTYLFPSLFPGKEPHPQVILPLESFPLLQTPDLPWSYHLREDERRNSSHLVFDLREVFTQEFKATLGLGMPSLSNCLPSRPIQVFLSHSHHTPHACFGTDLFWWHVFVCIFEITNYKNYGFCLWKNIRISRRSFDWKFLFFTTKPLGMGYKPFRKMKRNDTTLRTPLTVVWVPDLLAEWPTSLRLSVLHRTCAKYWTL